MLETRTTSFLSQGQRCAAWITYPDGPGSQGRGPQGRGPHPAVVLVHGFGATRGMRLEQYEQAFAGAGMVTLSFDFRHLGASEGAPRQFVSIRRQLADVEAALEFLARDDRVDADRRALWGTSLGATHVLLTAAARPEVAAAVVQCPVLDTRNAALSAGPRAIARLAGPVVGDLIRSVLRLPRRYVGIVDEPGRTAIVTVPGATQGWHTMVPPGVEFDNRVTAATALELVGLNAARRAAAVRAPLLVCVSDRETLTDPRIASRVAQQAPRGEAVHYPADHFEVYHPPMVERVIGDQVEFLTRHLAPASAGRARRA